MDLSTCIECGFKCESVCPVGRATGKFKLSDFLHRFFEAGDHPSWPCTGCHTCDLVCPGEFTPRELVNKARQGFLVHGENILSDYHDEYIERGRIGVSGLNVDDLVSLNPAFENNDFFSQWDAIIIFSGCLVSSRFPRIILELHDLLLYLGAHHDQIIIDDETCCGSFLQQVNEQEFLDNGNFIMKKRFNHGSKTLVITACGSCTSALRELYSKYKQTTGRHGIAAQREIVIEHYLTFLTRPDIMDRLLPLVKQDGTNGNFVYMQFPCQAEDNGKKRNDTVKNLSKYIHELGFTPVSIKNDLVCCGASILDTHPDFAIEYGIQRFQNIINNENCHVNMILIGCGNCYRMYEDFKPSMEVVSDEMDEIPVKISFLLDMIMSRLKK